MWGDGKCRERPARVQTGGGRIVLGHGSWHLPGPLLSRAGQVLPTAVDLEELGATCLAG